MVRKSSQIPLRDVEFYLDCTHEDRNASRQGDDVGAWLVQLRAKLMLLPRPEREQIRKIAEGLVRDALAKRAKAQEATKSVSAKEYRENLYDTLRIENAEHQSQDESWDN